MISQKEIKIGKDKNKIKKIWNKKIKKKEKEKEGKKCRKKQKQNTKKEKIIKKWNKK